MSHPPVLVLDLDGTCIYTDTFQELLGLALSQKPWMILQVLWWLVFRDRPYAKRRLVESIAIDPAQLPYNEDFLREAYAYAQKGHYVVLATGTHKILADQIANYLGFFHEVIATEEHVNMTGHNKAKVLIERFGEQGFIYAGDSRKDGQVWPHASDIWVVNPKMWVTTIARHLVRHPSKFRFFPRGFSRMGSFFAALYPRTWLQNLAIFLPVFFLGIPLKLELFGAILMLNCVTSGAGVLRDLMGLNKHNRHYEENPFAMGYLSAVTGLILVPVFFLTAALLGVLINPALVMILLLWVILLVQDEGLLSGISRVIGPILIGCLI